MSNHDEIRTEGCQPCSGETCACEPRENVEPTDRGCCCGGSCRCGERCACPGGCGC